MIIIESKRRSIATIEQRHPGAIIIDVTSKSKDRFVQFSPFYPHGGIPIPFSDGYFAMSVEGIWQGLKVFEKADVDFSCFSNTSMKNLKRSSKKYGKVLGHRKGIAGTDLLGYSAARFEIYLPAYLWVLENKLQDLVNEVKLIDKDKVVVLLDYNTNEDCYALNKPLSHAGLIKSFIEGSYPEPGSYSQNEELTLFG